MQPLAQGEFNDIRPAELQIVTHQIQLLNHVGIELNLKPRKAAQLIALALNTFINPALVRAVIGVAARTPRTGRRKHIDGCAIIGLDGHEYSTWQKRRNYPCPIVACQLSFRAIL